MILYAPFSSDVVEAANEPSLLKTLMVTPAMLAIRVWISKGLRLAGDSYLRMRHGRDVHSWADRQLRRAAHKLTAEDVDWINDVVPTAKPLRLRNPLPTTPQAAE